MSEWALKALVLIAVDNYASTWCALNWLAGRVAAPMNRVQETCDELVDSKLLQAAALPDGSRCYGVQCSEAEIARVIP